MNFFSNSLGQRIVTYMILASALLSILAAGFQLYASYNRELSRVMDEFEIVDSSFRFGLETALWQFNFDQVDALLDGIYAQPDVVRVTLTASTGQTFARGGPSETITIVQDLDLFYTAAATGKTQVGSLAITLSLADLRNSLFTQFLTILASNFIKTLLASVIMLVIFDRMVSRHLRDIVAQIKNPEWLENAPLNKIDLARPKSQTDDEIQQIATTLDATALREYQTRSEITRVRSRLETVLRAASSGIIACNSLGEVVLVNAQARQLFPSLPEAMPFAWPGGQYFTSNHALAPLPTDQDPISQALNGIINAPQIYLIAPDRPSEPYTFVRVNVATLPESRDGISFVVVLDDVSDQERNRQVMERKSRLDALGQLTGGIAHDFNNLLAAVLYAVDLARTIKDDNKREMLLETAIKSVDRGRALTSRLLAFAKRQPGLSHARPVSETLIEFERLLAPLIERRIEIDIEPPAPDLRIYCDHAQLESALLNLVLNSRDAIARADCGDKISILARAVSSADISLNDRQIAAQSSALSDDEAYRFVEITVTDNGPGMDAATVARATDPFFTTKDTSSGTGLGLSMVYGFVQQAHGDLRIYSEENIGTTVKITLPRGSDEDKREVPMQKEALIKGAGETVFLVEDETDLLLMVQEMLVSLGYVVIVASSGDAALKMATSGAQFDILLTDVVMPGKLNGFQLAAEIRALRPDVPVLYTSGYTGFTTSEMGNVRAKVLQKPATPTDLAKALSTALNADN